MGGNGIDGVNKLNGAQHVLRIGRVHELVHFRLVPVGASAEMCFENFVVDDGGADHYTIQHAVAVSAPAGSLLYAST